MFEKMPKMISLAMNRIKQNPGTPIQRETRICKTKKKQTVRKVGTKKISSLSRSINHPIRSSLNRTKQVPDRNNPAIQSTLVQTPPNVP